MATRVLLTEVTTLPLLAGDQPVVLARIPGFGSARLLVDTGAEFSWIDRSFAERTGMAREPLGATLTDINGQQTAIAERALIDRLELGAAVVTDFRPPIFDAIWPDIDGSLGQDLLRVLLVIVDGPAGELVLAPKHSKMDTLEWLYLPGGAATSYALSWDGGIPAISVPVDGLSEPLAFRIDTGVGSMTLTQAAVDELGWTPVRTTQSPGLAGGSASVPVYEVDGLEIGRLPFWDDALLLDHASLGWGVLRHKVLVFDNTDDSLWLADLVRK